ncbi:MAG: hypothetical protein AAFY60_11415 [Myxococcota bacterium]
MVGFDGENFAVAYEKFDPTLNVYIYEARFIDIASGVVGPEVPLAYGPASSEVLVERAGLSHAALVIQGPDIVEDGAPQLETPSSVNVVVFDDALVALPIVQVSESNANSFAAAGSPTENELVLAFSQTSPRAVTGLRIAHDGASVTVGDAHEVGTPHAAAFVNATREAQHVLLGWSVPSDGQLIAPAMTFQRVDAFGQPNAPHTTLTTADELEFLASDGSYALVGYRSMDDLLVRMKYSLGDYCGGPQTLIPASNARYQTRSDAVGIGSRAYQVTYSRFDPSTGHHATFVRGVFDSTFGFSGNPECSCSPTDEIVGDGIDQDCDGVDL